MSAFTIKRKKTGAALAEFSEGKVVSWIEKALSIKKGATTTQQWLADGFILCRLLNAIEPRAIAQYHKAPISHFHKVQNLSLFISNATRLAIFQTARAQIFSVSFRQKYFSTNMKY